ncbi:unnamed protein product [Orchesella dallaii]|uniref:Gustatory receptor n=1 Tax=Orchesella dallaii TaxID=48710 RepID=A0ABP1S7M8_9HEXA
MKSLIGVRSTFPKGAELWLTTFLNLGFTTFTTPMRLRLDVHKNKYVLQKSVIRKIICLTRAFLVFVVFLITLIFHTNTLIPTNKGPLGVLLAGYYVGYVVLSIGYLTSMISSSTCDSLLKLVNLIRGHKTATLETQKRVRITVEVIFFFVVNLIVPLFLLAQDIHSVGLNRQLRSRWYRLIDLDKKKANAVLYSPSGDYSQEDFPIWKWIISFLFLLSEIDHRIFIPGSSLTLLVMTAKTLESGCIHFATSIRDAQKFFSISSDELLMVSRFLIGGLHSPPQRISTNSISKGCGNIGKFIAIHEINSGKVGLRSSGFFVLSYGFIAGMMVTLMSNSAIVLQNFQFMVASNVPMNSTTEETTAAR